MKVFVSALADVFYYSFYLEGLYDVAGKENVYFSVDAFPSFPERFFGAIVEMDGKSYNVVIDAFDSARIHPKLLAWGDVYAKVNYNLNCLPLENRNKIIPIGPSFGVRIWNLPKTLFFAVSNYVKAKDRLHNQRDFFANYWRQYKRLPLKEYFKMIPTQGKEINFLSSQWKNEPETNYTRAQFINACKNLKGIVFSGGFAPRSDGKDVGYQALETPRISLSEYLKKMKESTLVFNTPAVENCHGWKLGEYLAMGKAILSTPHYNELPYPLVDRKHVHYTEPKVEILEKDILKITEDNTYRETLEMNARQYFENYLAPKAVIEQILNHLIDEKE